jgi:hypothetical protein
MNKRCGIQGFEFDWFAIDQDGHCALFAAGGSGIAPVSAINEMSAHDAVGEGIEVSLFGSPAVWQSYARVGLFAFDWSGTQGAYIRVAEPTRSPSSRLTAAIGAIPNVHRFSLSFSKATLIKPNW